MFIDRYILPLLPLPIPSGIFGSCSFLPNSVTINLKFYINGILC